MSDEWDSRLRAVFQAAEGADVVVCWEAIVKVALADDAEAVAYRHYWSGTLDERLGLLRYATIRTEALTGEGP